MRVDLRPRSDLGPEEVDELRALDIRVHGPPEARAGSSSARIRWAGLDDAPYVVRVWQDETLVSQLH